MQNTNSNTTGWVLFVKLSFVISLLAMVAAIFFMPGDLMLKGYLALNSLFIVSSTIMVSKTVRDEYENQKLINRKTELSMGTSTADYTE